jgi:Protein of Unknown function (DUF2784)
MWYSILTNIVLVLHFGFVLFVLFGGLLILKWPKVIWLHLPAVSWGAVIEFTGWICPLTPLEHWLRTRGGESSPAGDFVARYLLSILYPEALTNNIQVMLGVLVLLVNLAVYGCLWQRNHRRHRSTPLT